MSERIVVKVRDGFILLLLAASIIPSRGLATCYEKDVSDCNGGESFSFVTSCANQTDTCFCTHGGDICHGLPDISCYVVPDAMCCNRGLCPGGASNCSNCAGCACTGGLTCNGGVCSAGCLNSGSCTLPTDCCSGNCSGGICCAVILGVNEVNCQGACLLPGDIGASCSHNCNCISNCCNGTGVTNGGTCADCNSSSGGTIPPAAVYGGKAGGIKLWGDGGALLDSVYWNGTDGTMSSAPGPWTGNPVNPSQSALQCPGGIETNCAMHPNQCQ